MSQTRRTFCLCCASVLALGSAATAAWAGSNDSPTTLPSLLERFAQSPGFSAAFVEEKRIQLLEAPLQNKGHIHFSRPSMFARYVEQPFASSLVLKGNKLTLTEGKDSRVIDLKTQPAVGALAKSFLALLDGDAKALHESHDVQFTSQPEGTWNVALSPKDASVKRMIARLSFSGNGSKLATMTLTEKNGDVSTTRFSDVHVARVFTEEEKQRLFGK